MDTRLTLRNRIFAVPIAFALSSIAAFAGSLGDGNIALGKSVTPLTNTINGAPAEVVDGTIFDGWGSQKGIAPHNCEDCIAFILDLEFERPIQTIVVDVDETWHLKISVSLDGNSWQLVESRDFPWAFGEVYRFDFPSPLNARYLKYEASTDRPHYVIEVSEIEVYETIPVPPTLDCEAENIALNATVTDDITGSTSPPENAFDGDPSTDWISAGIEMNDETKKWHHSGFIAIDLGQVYNLGKIVIKPRRFQYALVLLHPEDRLSGENWSFIAHQGLYSNGQTTDQSGTLYFEGVTTRSVWIFVSNFEVTQTKTVAISEIEIYPLKGSDDTNSQVFLPPIPGQSWTRSIRIDSNGNGEPDKNDETVDVIRESDSMNYMTLISERWGSTIVELADPNPQTGQFQQVIHRRPQSAVATALGRPFAEDRQSSERNETTVVTLDSLDANFRPSSFSLKQTRIKDGVTTVRTGSGGAEDSNGNGAPDEFSGSGSDTPRVSMSLVYSDVNNDGKSDYASIPWAMAEVIGVNTSDGTHDPQVWVPLGDTDGDGTPDSPAFDFDQNNLPDPTLPIAPVVTRSPLSNIEYHLNFAQLADGIGGNAQFISQIYLLNLTEKRANSTVTIRKQNGDLFPLRLNGQDFAGSEEYVVPSGGLKILTTGGTKPLEVGSVSVKSDRPLAGVTAYAAPGFGAAGVGSSPQVGTGFISPIQRDLSQKIDIGVAIMNLNEQSISFEAEIFDTEGTYTGKSSVVSIPAHGQIAMMLGNFTWDFAMSLLDSFNGLLKVRSTGEIAATVIQTRPGEYATQPVVANLNPKSIASSQPIFRMSRAGDLGLEHKLHFAQFVNGSIGDLFIRSKIYLFNQDSTGPANARVLIRGDNGEFLNLVINGESVQGQVELSIPTNGVRILEPEGGEGKITTGSVTVQSDKLVSGTLLFASQLGTAGVGNSTELTQGFVAPMLTNQLQKIDTGIAVMNPTEKKIILDIELCDLNGDLLTQSQLQIPPLGHKALLIKEFGWNPVLNLDNFRGVMKVTTDDGDRIAATIIQTRPNQYLTMPVAPKLM